MTCRSYGTHAAVQFQNLSIYFKLHLSYQLLHPTLLQPNLHRLIIHISLPLDTHAHLAAIPIKIHHPEILLIDKLTETILIWFIMQIRPSMRQAARRDLVDSVTILHVDFGALRNMSIPTDEDNIG